MKALVPEEAARLGALRNLKIFNTLLECTPVKRKQEQKKRQLFFSMIAAGFGLASVILVVIGVVSYRSLTGLIETSNQETNSRKVLEKLEKVFSQVKDAETGQRGYVITGEEHYLEPYHAAIKVVDRDIKAVRELTADNPEQQQRLDTLEPLIEQRIAVSKQIIDLRKHQGFEVARQLVLTGKGQNLMDDIREVIREIEREENKLLTQRSRGAEASTRKTILTFSSGIFLTFFILIAVYYFIYRESTERQQAEEALLESQTRLKLINSISTSITSGMSVEQVIERTVKQISSYFNTLRVAYSTIDENSYLTVLHSIEPPGMPPLVGKSTNLTIASEYLDALRVCKLVFVEDVAVHVCESVIVEDIATDSRLAPLADAMNAYGTKAFLDVPLQHSEQLVGLLCFDSPFPRKWSEHETVTLKEVANYLSVAIKEANAQQERQQAELALQQVNEKLNCWVNELEQRNREITLLAEMSDVLQACLTVEEAYTTIATFVSPIFPDTSGGIFLNIASKNLVEAVATWGSPLSNQELFTAHECWALRRGQVHWVENTHKGLLCNHAYGDSSRAESLCVPMMAQGEALGLLHLSSLKFGAIAQSKRQLASAVAEQIALALANIKLRETLQNQSIRDPLTGLFNRRYMEESLERELARCNRKQQSLGIIMLDVDHFKRFNDTFGHEAGDAVLRELGQFLQIHIRKSDIACRYGGEELMLILPEASVEIVAERAEEIRKGVKHLQVQHHGQILGAIALSLGVACFPEHGSTGEAVIRAADTALYCAKKEGRDAVRLAPSGSRC